MPSALANHALVVPVVGLKQIRRQHNPEYREAVAWLAKGDPYRAFAQLDRLGAGERGEGFLQDARSGGGHICFASESRRVVPGDLSVWSEVHALTRKSVDV